jgi:hypothetical protein
MFIYVLVVSLHFVPSLLLQEDRPSRPPPGTALAVTLETRLVFWARSATQITGQVSSTRRWKRVRRGEKEKEEERRREKRYKRFERE